VKKSLLALTVLALCSIALAADRDTANVNRKQTAAESAGIYPRPLPGTPSAPQPVRSLSRPAQTTIFYGTA
jgi:hypothetical protein